MTSDEERENRITDYIKKLISASTIDERHKWWSMARDEIIQRSPQQVEKMEGGYGFNVRKNI